VNNLYDVLEICLQEVENGMDLEMVLARYPDQADELRPILQASINAQQMAVPTPSDDVVRRNRAKLLQHAAQMRKTQPAVTNSWFSSFQRLTVALVLLLLFFVSSTGFVRASSNSLPGDGLYAVKRSWEDVTLFFTFDSDAHQALELEYESERLDEINELFASGRPAKVDFAGIVTRQNGAGWRVANILVIVSERTTLPDQPVAMGAAVRVTGTTNGDGIVLAERIELLPADAIVPEVEDDQPEIEAEQPSVTTPQPDHGTSNSGAATEMPELEITSTPAPLSTPKIESFEGILNSISKDVWTVNDIVVNVATAEIKGVPVLGARAKVEGYYRSDGVFVAIKIEIINNSSSGSNSNSNSNDAGGANTNSNSNDNGGSNSNDNDDNDNSGKDDNSNDDNNNNGG